ARGMSVSQVIPAGVTSLNRGSHVSGDTCHMMPPSLARRASGEGPHRAGVDPVRPFRTTREGGDALVPGLRGGPAPTPMGAGRPSAGVRPDEPTAFGCPGSWCPAEVFGTREAGAGGERGARRGARAGRSGTVS